MKLTTTALLAGAGLASAAVPNVRPILGRTTSLLKRWEYDVCSNDCHLRDVPMPDKNTFGLPLEGYWSEQCPPLVVGAYDAPLSTSRACLDFQGTNLYFNFSSFPGYTLKSAVVTWKVKGVVGEPSTWTSPPPTTNILCDAPSTPGGQYVCKLPFSTILGVPSSTSLLDLFAGMCPKTDREALIFYLQLSGLVAPVDGNGPDVPFVQQYPCTSRTPDRQCTAWDTNYPYIEVAYRCSKCEVAACPPPPSSTSAPPPPPSSTTPPPPPPSSSAVSSVSPTTTTSAPPSIKTCGFGTAFGYLPPVGSTPRSTTLNTLSGQGCNRWGWYSSPSLAELQSGSVSGPLYVGAGGNDISKAVNVGTWTAVADILGKVTVTYLLSPGYALAEVHVNLKCVADITKCAPGQYTYNSAAIPNLSTWSTTPLSYPSCGAGKVGLIVHAAVNVLTTATTCEPPKAT